VRNREPGPGSGLPQNGQPEMPAMDDERLRDHHIEEMLSTFKEVARMRESGSGAGEEGLD
jgi:hypothetical protein